MQFFFFGGGGGWGAVNKEHYKNDKFFLGSVQSLLRSLALPDLARGRG